MKNKFPLIVLKKENALRVEVSQKKNKWRTTPYKIWIFKCGTPDCENEIRVWCNNFKRSTGYCTACHRKKRPFGVAYNRLLSNCALKGIKNELTYEQFVGFTRIDRCVYCDSQIEWTEFSSSNNASVAYNLDRKDAGKNYSVKNCVVCCKICNWAKNNLFTHEEFLVIGRAIKKVLKERK